MNQISTYGRNKYIKIKIWNLQIGGSYDDDIHELNKLSEEVETETKVYLQKVKNNQPTIYFGKGFQKKNLLSNKIEEFFAKYIDYSDDFETSKKKEVIAIKKYFAIHNKIVSMLNEISKIRTDKDEIQNVVKKMDPNNLFDFLLYNSKFEYIDTGYLMQYKFPYFHENYIESDKKEFIEKILPSLDLKTHSKYDIQIQFDISYNSIYIYSNKYKPNITIQNNNLFNINNNHSDEEMEKMKENFQNDRLKLGEMIYFIYNHFLSKDIKYIDDFIKNNYSTVEINSFKDNPTKYSNAKKYTNKYDSFYYREQEIDEQKLIEEHIKKYNLKMEKVKQKIEEIKEGMNSIKIFRYLGYLTPNEKVFKSKKNIVNYLPTNNKFIIKFLFNTNDLSNHLALDNLEKLSGFIKVTKFNHQNLVKVYNILLVIGNEIWYIMENANFDNYSSPLSNSLKESLESKDKEEIDNQSEDVIKYLNDNQYLFDDVFYDDIFWNSNTKKIKMIDWSGFNGFKIFKKYPHVQNKAISNLIKKYLYF